MKENLRELFFNIQIFMNLNLQIFIVYIIFSLFVLYLILTDDRFKKGRKVLFIILNILFLLISIVINKAPYLIIKDLFWYSLVLNTLFIIHVLILNRFFVWLLKKKRYLLATIISRISFICSIWGLICIIRKIIDKLRWWYIISNHDLILQKKNIYYYIFKYESYIMTFLYLIIIVLIYFSIIFHLLSKIYLGKMKVNWDKWMIIENIIKFVVFFVIALVLGIPRLYIIWFIYSIYELYNILTFKYSNERVKNDYANNKTIREKMNFIFSFDKKHYLLVSYYHDRYKLLNKIIIDVYNDLFIFDLIKFLYEKYDCVFCDSWDYIDDESLRKNIILSIWDIRPLWKILYDYVELIYLCENAQGEVYYCGIDNSNIYEKKKYLLSILLKDSFNIYNEDRNSENINLLNNFWEKFKNEYKKKQ